jgi:vancomycin resistance protein YoaR
MKLLRLSGLSLAFGLLGGGIGYLLLPERAPEAAALPRIRVLGRVITPGSDAHAAALAVARAYLREHVRISAPVVIAEQNGTTFRRREETRTIDRTRESLGARVDVRLLAHLISAATDPTSPMLRHHAALAPGQPVDLPLPVRLDGAIATPILMQLKEEVDHAPIDARLDVENRRIEREQPGRHLDIYRTLARLEEALARGETELRAVVAESQPRVTAAQLANVQMNEVVGWFETNYNADESKRDRTYNLHLAASKINGYVWMPGEVFDFNAVVGDRSEANGFRMATVISAGELIDGIGGGTCQIAGTLHAAAFFAGMEILDRRPHTRPSGYIKMGLDATVVYPSINLRMRNNLPFPVVIRTRLGQGLARIELLGARRTRTVTFVRKIMHIDRFEEREVPDPNLPPGVRVLTQRGIPGFRVRRYRIVREGDQAVRERWEDTYPPTVQFWHVGVGGGAGNPPAPDDHGEYTADQYMATTQAPGELRMQEVRRPGISGTPGWMVRQGLTRELPPSVAAQPARASGRPGAGRPPARRR